MIPKRAHFVWFGSAPDWVSQMVGAFRLLHPGWSVTLWDRFPDDFPKDLADIAKRCTQRCQWADLLYLWLLVRDGGIVMDCDVVPNRNFEPLLDRMAFTTRHDNRDLRLTNGVMGGAKDAECFVKILDAISHRNPPGGAMPRTWIGLDVPTTLQNEKALPDLDVLPWHYFYPFGYGERDRAETFWKAGLPERRMLLNSIKDRFIDDQWPYAVHLWGVEGSSTRRTKEA